MEIIIKGSLRLGLPLLVGCGQLHLLFNQIAGFDEQYPWKKSSDILDFLRGDNRGRLHLSLLFWLGVVRCTSSPSILQDCLFINISGRIQLMS